MIDPATLATYNSLETHGERNIFLMLMLIAEPVPKPNVAGIVKMDRTYCKELLDKLVKDGIIAEFEKFGITYCLPVLLRTESAPSFSPFCGESVQENINSNLKKERKKRDSNF